MTQDNQTTRNKVIKLTEWQKMLKDDIVDIKQMNIQQNEHILNILTELKGMKTTQGHHQKIIFAIIVGLFGIAFFVIRAYLLR